MTTRADPVILIALGANLPSHAGRPEETLRASMNALSQNGVMPLAVSRAFETPAWPDPADPAFVNAVARIETALDPAALMDLLAKTEVAFGRERSRPNAPRALDIDLIDYDGRIEAGPPILPHPRAHLRAFVLIPLADVAPDWCHPVSGNSVDDLLAAVPQADRRGVRPLGSLWP